MRTKTVSLPGCFEIQPEIYRDDRGLFVKTFHVKFFEKNALQTIWSEEYYTVSKLGVLRGLHFQLPPHDHEKLIFCISGKVLDVVVDLRKGAPTFGEYVKIDLSAEKGNMIYIPKGMAHGFFCFSKEAILVYKVSSVYAPEFDSGIRWDSVGIDWPTDKPLISERDRGLTKFNEFVSPFTYLDK